MMGEGMASPVAVAGGTGVLVGGGDVGVLVGMGVYVGYGV
jgi:hypothetical protein